MTMLRFDEPLLTGAQEAELAHTIEVGVLAGHVLDQGPTERDADLRALREAGERAYQRFVSANLRLVTHVIAASKAARAQADPDELFQEGVLGLLEAVRRYDHRRGARFATFALPWIRMRIGEWSLTRGGGLGLPARRARSWVQVRAVTDALTQERGASPSLAEVSAVAGLPVRQVSQLLAYRPAVATDTASLADVPSSEPPPEGDALAVHRLVRRLSREERAVLAGLYGLGGRGASSYDEVAQRLGVSVSTVRRREHAALARLRDAWTSLDAA